MNSPGGYGKTFAFTVLAAKLRCEGKIVLNVATTGLAAQNLQGGRTAHSRFKIPIPIHEDSTCGIKAQSDLAKLIKETSLIIWDEVFSSDRFNVEAVERSLRDIMENEDDFGGKIVCLSGDPRQTLDSSGCEEGRKSKDSQSLFSNVSPVSKDEDDSSY